MLSRRCTAILAVLVAVHAAAVSAVPPPAVQYGADCESPTFATDILVCADVDLRSRDAEVRRLFERLRQDAPGTATQLEASQSGWFQRRSECAMESDHRQCVVEAYAERLAALQVPGTGAGTKSGLPELRAPYAFWLTALIAVAIGASMRRIAQRTGKRMLGIAGGLWLAYALYEAFVQVLTPEANIRADLLVLYPLLLVFTLAGLLRK